MSRTVAKAATYSYAEWARTVVARGAAGAGNAAAPRTTTIPATSPRLPRKEAGVDCMLGACGPCGMQDVPRQNGISSSRSRADPPFGAVASRREAARLTTKAMAALDPIGEPAHRLREIAAYMLDREY